MRRTSRFIAALAAVALSIPVLTSAADITLVNIDGTGLVRDLDEVARMEFTDGGTAYRLVARADGSEIVSGSLDDLRRLSFVAEEINSGVETAVEAFSVDGEDITSRSGEGVVRIYGLGGVLVRTGEAGRVDTKGLKAGAYIVVSDGKAVMVRVK